MNEMNEINIELGSLDLEIYYTVSPLIGIDILYIYFHSDEISGWLNHYAIAEIKQLIWAKIK
jgi:hypothetical protein